LFWKSIPEDCVECEIVNLELIANDGNGNGTMILDLVFRTSGVQENRGVVIILESTISRDMDRPLEVC
jgi:hypothetical protein